MPSSLVWNDDYCIGHDVIDSEHKRLFDIAGQIFAINNPLMDMPAIKKLVHELYNYMKEHFEHEEGYMADAGYADKVPHREKHAEIIGEMNDILRFSTNFVQVENRLVSLMKKWLLDHILKEDLRVKKALDIHESEKGETVRSS